MKQETEISLSLIEYFKQIQAKALTTKFKPYIHPVGKKTQSLILTLSDWHFGKEVKIKGINEYSLKEAQIRLTSLFKNFMDIYQYAKRSANIDELIFILAGDIIDNESIYPTQAHHIEMAAVQQVSAAVDSLWKFIGNTRKSIPNTPIRIICNRGNHGRFFKEANEKSNFDLLIYYQLQLLFDTLNHHCKDFKNIYFEISDEEFTLFEVKGWKGLIRHELPPQTKTPAARSKLLGWYNIHKFNFAVGGHWHFPQVCRFNDIPLFQNGSLVGIDDLAERMSLRDTPGQLVWGVSKERVNTHIYFVDIKP